MLPCIPHYAMTTDFSPQISDTVHETAVVLANAGELAAAIISRVAGNDISTAVNGSVLSKEMIKTLAMQAVETAAMDSVAR